MGKHLCFWTVLLRPNRAQAGRLCSILQNDPYLVFDYRVLVCVMQMLYFAIDYELQLLLKFEFIMIAHIDKGLKWSQRQNLLFLLLKLKSLVRNTVSLNNFNFVSVLRISGLRTLVLAIPLYS